MVSALPPKGLETAGECGTEPCKIPGPQRLRGASLPGSTPSVLSQIYGRKVTLSPQGEDSGNAMFNAFPVLCPLHIYP